MFQGSVRMKNNEKWSFAVWNFILKVKSLWNRRIFYVKTLCNNIHIETIFF